MDSFEFGVAAEPPLDHGGATGPKSAPCHRRSRSFRARPAVSPGTDGMVGVADGPNGQRRNRTSVLARPTGFERADARNIRIPIEDAGANLMAKGA